MIQGSEPDREQTVKKIYVSPQLRVYGDVQQLTRAFPGGAVPDGPPLVTDIKTG